jgi:sterol 14-demethylase
LHPSADLLFRTANEDIELDGRMIPKGASVFLNAINTHNLPELWTHPEQFDPYRWLPENRKNIDSQAIMGFGGGIHKCAGMNFAKNEMAVIVGLLFQQFEVTLISEDIYKITGSGAQRPSTVRVHYRRKPFKS